MFFLKNQKKRIKSPRYTNGLLDGAALPIPRCHIGGVKRSESRDRGDSSAGSASGDSVPRPLSAPAGLNLMVPQDTPFEEQYARIICHHQDYYHRLQSRKEKANKVATIRQHYYPEGGWGWAVSGCGLVVHLLADGTALAFAHLLGQVHRKWSHVSVLSIGSGGARYKIICHTVIVENRGAGVRVSYGQQWDVDSDGAASHFYSSSCLQCTCTVLAVFYY